ncbi:Galactose-1-phosphate uridylyltransferase [Streptococcus oralis]|uniref:Galactose-1-phosphate uridylyltransferase n=1 Tax=Streptococcus oralis TaxID=1303 RepID=A0A139RPW1_STROR|nr:Galactose-1-phosphate uridylyltransferase [Streptococcus oralis]
MIEVMGLAILPPRLKAEVEQVASYLVGDGDIVADYHQEWADQLKAQHPDLADKEKALEIVKDSVGAIFARVLEDAGVYKQTEQGQAAVYAICRAGRNFARLGAFSLHSPIKSSIIVSFENSGGNDERFSF